MKSMGGSTTLTQRQRTHPGRCQRMESVWIWLNHNRRRKRRPKCRKSRSKIRKLSHLWRKILRRCTQNSTLNHQKRFRQRMRNSRQKSKKWLNKSDKLFHKWWLSPLVDKSKMFERTQHISREITITTFGTTNTSQTADLTKNVSPQCTNATLKQVSQNFFHYYSSKSSNLYSRYGIHQSRQIWQRGILLHLLCERKLLRRSKLLILPLSSTSWRFWRRERSYEGLFWTIASCNLQRRWDRYWIIHWRHYYIES